MEDNVPTNPYKAGFGLAPPYLAGRHKEIRVIEKALDEIKGGAGRMRRSPDPVLALVGPRGVGKTVLLGRAVLEAQRRGIHVGEIDRNLLSRSQDEIVSQVLPAGDVKKFFDRLKSAGGSVAGSGVSLGLYETHESLRPAMLEFLAKGPMLLILDEAHRGEPAGMSMLFDIVQSCLREQLPLAVIIAGTPGLVQHLRRSEVTYVDRSKFLHFNTLSRAEAGEALEVPARKAGRPMDEGALNCLLDWSDNYPFFIQMAGEHAWDAAQRRGAGGIGPEDAKQGLVSARDMRREFYRGRYQELVDMELDTYALQVIELIEGRPSNDIGYKKLIVGIQGANEGMEYQRALEIQKLLMNLGFIFDNGEMLEAGIPSLFDYVKEQEDV